MIDTIELKKLVKEYSDSYKALCESSRDEYMKTLSPGSPIPKAGKLYTAEAQQRFKTKCDTLRAKAADVINSGYSDLSKRLTAPPEPGAFDTVNMLKMRDDVTADEIDMLLTRYRNNPQTYKAIQSAAAEKGLRGFYNHPDQERFEKLKTMDKRLQKTFTPFEANRGYAEGWRVSVLNDEIDALND